MSAVSLRCRRCDAEHPLIAVGTCSKCFAPLEPVYDREAQKAKISRQSIQAGPLNIWRYADLLPVAAPREQRLAPGMTPLVSAPRLAAALGIGELWIKTDTANPTHSFKDRVVAVACAKALELSMDTLACSSTGNLANAVAARAAAEGIEGVVFVPADLEPEKLLATAVYGATLYAVQGTYDDCSRLNVELSFELPWGFVNTNLRSYYAEGSKTIAYEIVEQLGWELPTAVVSPIASGALYARLAKGFGEFIDLGLVQGSVPRIYGGQAAGCHPVVSAFEEDRRVVPVRPNSIARSLAIGSPADGDIAVETAKATGGKIYSVPEEDIGTNMALLAEQAGVFGETAAGVTLGALREAVKRGELGEKDRVVLVVTGDGLKTPEPVNDRLKPIAIAPDADALLDRLGITV